MSWVAVAVAGAGIVGGVMSSNAQKDAANTAAGAQTQATQLGVAEQQRQFDSLQKLLAPYAQAGQGSLAAQQDLTGANGPEAQQKAITALQQTPAFTSQLKIGENRILANASATGGLRGGNVQAALGLFSPQLLSQTINDQYNRLGGITSIGQNAAAMTGNAGMQLGSNVSGLYQQAGAAQAGAALAGGRATAGMYGSIAQGVGSYVGAGGRFGFTPTPDAANFGTGAGYGNQDYGTFP